jgi:hypothetical protein
VNVGAQQRPVQSDPSPLFDVCIHFAFNILVPLCPLFLAYRAIVGNDTAGTLASFGLADRLAEVFRHGEVIFLSVTIATSALAVFAVRVRHRSKGFFLWFSFIIACGVILLAAARYGTVVAPQKEAPTHGQLSGVLGESIWYVTASVLATLAVFLHSHASRQLFDRAYAVLQHIRPH